MSIQLGNLAIAAGVKAIFKAPSDGCKAILIGNASGLTCTIAMESGGVSKTLYPGVLDWFQVNPGFTGNIQINPQALLSNVSQWPASLLIFDAIGLRDPEQASQYPQQIGGGASNQGNFVGTQQAMQVYPHSHGFFSAGGTDTTTIATAPKGQSIWIAGIDLYTTQNNINANIVGIEWLISGLQSGYGGTLTWGTDQNAGTDNMPPVPIRFPGPLQGNVGGAVSLQLTIGSAGDSGAIVVGANVYYFIQ